MLRRIAVLASLAILAAMFVGSSSAQAALGDNLTCVFNGVSGELSPAIAGGEEDFGFDPNNPGVPTDPDLDVELGTYNFSGDANCAGQVGLTPVVPEQDGDNANIVSDGDYANYVCGSGWATDADGSGTKVDVEAIGAAGSFEAVGIGYEVRFTAGAGPLNIGTRSANPESPPGPGLGNGLGGNYIGVGAVAIVPQGLSETTNNCASDAVEQFDVNGGFIGVDNQNADNVQP